LGRRGIAGFGCGSALDQEIVEQAAWKRPVVSTGFEIINSG
jgi:hypothetical protein